MYNNYYSGKIILVTGGGSGMGRGLCEKLAACGATVICTDINMVNANETIALVKQNGNQAIARKLDVSLLQDFEEVINDIAKEHGRIDMIFNNAGIGISGELRDLTIEHWKKVMDINFYGVLYGSQIAYRHMIKQGSGHIINTSSLAGLVDCIPLIAPYSASKQAVVNYTRILRFEAKAFNVRASIVCPGLIDTLIFNTLEAVNAKDGWTEHSTKAFAPGVPVKVAVDCILKGVAKNKEVIVFPLLGRFILLFSRYFKGLYKNETRKSLKDYRTNYRINEYSI
jgi:NAD(P)-dependent dehydrogenase (short-subunit alcohol dehydrogenase family)